jgi:Hemerythrin HHE cation binding domain
MPVYTRDFREAHAGLSERADRLAEAARLVPALAGLERQALLDRVKRFLSEEIVPHTKLDERVLYPEINARLRDPVATATMNYDHVAIRGLIDDLAAADVTDTDMLQELLYGLLALIRVHIWKEERLYVAMLEGSAWPAQ